MINTALLNRRLRQVHLWLGLGIGVQVILWLVSGLFMTWFPIEVVRGNHLTTQISPVISTTEGVLSPDQILEISSSDAAQISLKPIHDGLVWIVHDEDGREVYDARSGTLAAPLSEALAIAQARRVYTGNGEAAEATLFDRASLPREVGRRFDAYRVDFGPSQRASVYIDVLTGEVLAVRTPLWRTFDFMWGLHIMDWSSRENFNSWWIKMTASMAVLFAFAGTGLAAARVTQMIRRSRRG